MNGATNHNLNIHMYSLDDLFGLFDLPLHPTVDDIKRAKMKVLMSHPDKSKLPSEYFLFYKKAFEIVVQYFNNQNRQNQSMTEEAVQYKTMDTNKLNRSTNEKVKSTIQQMDSKAFQTKFNQLFEENMLHKPDSTKNDWFSSEKAIYQIDDKVNSKNMGQALERIKETQANIVLYRGVENMNVRAGGTSLYDDEDEAGTYCTSDPFSKLKYDDLRKVHKDQTVFAVSERDFQKIPQYTSTDHYIRERGKQAMNPLDKLEAERLLNTQERLYKERMMNKEYAAKLQTMQYADKNQTVMSQFLRLS